MMLSIYAAGTNCKSFIYFQTPILENTVDIQNNSSISSRGREVAMFYGFWSFKTYIQCTEKAVDDANKIHSFILAQTKELKRKSGL